jgi:peptidyl-prolyl cis-trans isomerase C
MGRSVDLLVGRVVSTSFMPGSFVSLGRSAIGLLALGLVASGCSRCAGEGAPAGGDGGLSVPARGLGSAQAMQVLATVGTVKITLGDYAAALDRMDRYERLRYQSAERRTQLLDEMINLELLADEARRQGLDKDPEIQLRLDQALRDEVLRDLHAKVPTPEQIPEPEVRSFFESHRKDFEEPERRRVAAIVVNDPSTAQKLVKEAKEATPAGWGQLVRHHSMVKSPVGEQTPLELEGDLGIVSLGAPQSVTSRPIPESVVKAVFALEKVGDVGPEPIAAEGRFYVVRLVGRTDARARSFGEAERSIRVQLVRAKIEEAERQLVEDLRRKIPVTIDQRVLGKMKLPPPAKSENPRDALRR